LTEETKIDRSLQIEDKRIHLCIYFISPTGHKYILKIKFKIKIDLNLSLKQLDIAFMQALQERVNLIPIIAKADTLTPTELVRFKQNVIFFKSNRLFFYLF
jgi:septin family protein